MISYMTCTQIRTGYRVNAINFITGIAHKQEVVRVIRAKWIGDKVYDHGLLDREKWLHSQCGVFYTSVS